MNKKLLIAFSLTAFALFGCSESSHTNNSGINNGEGDFAEDSFNSSSGISNRADIDYDGDVVLDDTTNIYFQTWGEDKDTTAKDSSAQKSCPESTICLDSLQNEVNLFLGELKKGTRISIRAATSGLAKDSLVVMNELGTIVSPMLSQCLDGNCIFHKSLIPGNGATLDSNQFAILEDGFYYVSLQAQFESKAHLRMVVHMDNGYYRYTGDSDKVNISLKDNLRGIIKIGDSPDSIKVKFGAPIGNSVTVKASGSWIKGFGLLENGKTLIAKTDTMDNTMLTDDTTSWDLVIVPESTPNYKTGPFATFTVSSSNRKLSQGEYFALPDSLKGTGVLLKKTRAKIDAFELRQDQYVWLGDFKKGDTLALDHHFKGYGERSVSPYTIIDYSILGKGGDSLKTISRDKLGYKVEKDGPVYLHFRMLNSQNTTDAKELELYTLVKRPGTLTTFNFYDASAKKVIETLNVRENQFLKLDSITFKSAPAETPAGAVDWYIPCQDLVILGNVVYESCDKELKVDDTENSDGAKILIINEGSSGDWANLIAESLIDPQKRDTLRIQVQ